MTLKRKFNTLLREMSVAKRDVLQKVRIEQMGIGAIVIALGSADCRAQREDHRNLGRTARDRSSVVAPSESS